MTAVVQTIALRHVYGADTPFERVALDGVDFCVMPGQIHGIIGHTGSGKSTLVQHLNGLLKPESGKVLLCGEDIWKEPKRIREVRRRVGLVFQYPEHQLFEETVGKDIEFGPRNMGVTGDELSERVSEAMSFAGLDESLRDKSPFELSGGQRRRAAIAGVIAMRPELLVLDEPTAGLDPAGREDLLRQVLSYNSERGAAVVLITHSMEDMARVAEHITVLSRGKAVMSAPVNEIFSRYAELKDLGLTVPQVAEVMRFLRSGGVEGVPDAYTVAQAVESLRELMVRRA